MNTKKTNYLVTILNAISIVGFFIYFFAENYLINSIMYGVEEGVGKSIYNSYIIEFCLNEIQLILTFLYGSLGILNIICAIQNGKNKKLCFWQAIFGINEVWCAISVSILLDNNDVVEFGNKILCGIIPIMFAIKNMILINKNRVKKIQNISYVLIIIFSILQLLDILGVIWEIVVVIFQFIYIHKQEKYIKESKFKKISNIVLYYVLQLVIVIGFCVMIITSILITKINDLKWEKELSKLYDNILMLQGAEIKDIYIPVEKGYKFGFINERGEEKISCQYDRVTYFYEIEINNNIYYIALAKKDALFYILSKSNDSIVINGALNQYLQTIYNYMDDTMLEMYNEYENSRNAYVFNFEFFLQILTHEEKSLKQQIVQISSNNKIILSESDSKYTYKHSNYTMTIEKIYEEGEDINNYNYGENKNTYDSRSEDIKYNVTITKTNGETQSSIVYLPGLDQEKAILETFSNGYIEFKNEDATQNGWYDSYGDKTTISNLNNYDIHDIKDNKIILNENNYDENREENYIIVDMNGKQLLQTTALDIYDNLYLVKNNNKMILMDKELNVVSNEYDKISTTPSIDVSVVFSSYD